jgi:two-component system nitrate/nitrite response regulator NarL
MELNRHDATRGPVNGGTRRSSHSDRITVVIADDQPVFRAGIARSIRRRAELNLLAEAENGQEALDAIREHRPQVGVVDLKLSDLDGLAIIRAVREERLETKIVLLTGHADPLVASDAMAAGAAGYVSKTSEPETVCEAVAIAARGGTYVTPELRGTPADRIRLHAGESGAPLSPREREVLNLAAHGESVKRISELAHISSSTVKIHFQHAYRKLGVNDRAAAVAAAMRQGVVD